MEKTLRVERVPKGYTILITMCQFQHAMVNKHLNEYVVFMATENFPVLFYVKIRWVIGANINDRNKLAT